MQKVWQDLNFASRMLRKNSGFAVIAILTLALGIGANTAIFSVVNAVLLRPLPYPDPARLIFISAIDVQTKTNGVSVSFTKFTTVHSECRTLEGISAVFFTPLSLVTEREAEAVNGARVSQDFFGVLGVSLAHGRSFLPEEEVPGAPDVAVISDGFWHSHFAGDQRAIGQTLNVDSKPVAIVGILPSSFEFPLQFPVPDLWLPRVSEHPLLTPVQIQGGAGYLSILARLRPGVNLSQAQAELETISERYKNQFGTYADAKRYSLSAAGLQESLVGDLRPSLLILMGAVGLVLLIACANVANLLLARATARQKEVALRKALGATRGRLVRQLLTESLLLSLMGGVLGILLGSAVMPLLRTISPGSVPRLAETQLDARVLIFSLVLSCITGIIFGLVPAFQAAGKELHDSLKEETRGSSSGGGRVRSRELLVVGEVSLALVLMTGAGLLLESFSHLLQVNPGFSPHSLMTFPLTLPATRYPQREQQAQFYRQVIERVSSVPSVQAAGVVSYLPLSGAIRMSYFCPEGRICEGLGKDPLIAFRQVSTGYFDAMQTPLLQGRVFNDGDRSGTLPVLVVNETTAKRFWPNGNPLGKHMVGSRDLVSREVVGVVQDVKFSAVSSANAEELYIPSEQMPWPAMTLLVRSRADSQTLTDAVRARIAEVDPSLPVAHISSMDNIVGASIAQPRLIMQLVVLFGACALLLAALGIYGVMAYSVSTRTREMGIRLSLGAARRDILRLVLGQGMRLAVAGVAVGVLASLALTRLISSLLFGVHATDPLALAAAALVLVCASLLACYLPASRAVRIDPIEALREE